MPMVRGRPRRAASRSAIVAASRAINPDDRGGRAVDAGSLPPWNVAEMPAPLPFSPKNGLRIAGAGAIILGVSIGSGAWLIGPAATAQYTAALLWVATASILLQWIFNEEACRYTLYTGEPITVGFMRTKPGPKFWGDRKSTRLNSSHANISY